MAHSPISKQTQLIFNLKEGFCYKTWQHLCGKDTFGKVRHPTQAIHQVIKQISSYERNRDNLPGSLCCCKIHMGTEGGWKRGRERVKGETRRDEMTLSSNHMVWHW